jgi:mannose-1-phosphate guanylyltransferase
MGSVLLITSETVGGSDVPKQFFPVLGATPLLEQTRRRASLSVPNGQTWFALNREHEAFFTPLLRDVRPGNLILQPGNRGTAPGILYSLLRVRKWLPQASVVLMPSDHYVGNEARMMRYVNEAFESVERRPELAVLLGATPDEPETGYGWIEQGLRLGSEADVFQVRRFWEKPARESAARLMADGGLWNTFIVVGRVSTLLGLFVVAMPELFRDFSRIAAGLGTTLEPQLAAELYRHLPSSDFSRRVLEVTAMKALRPANGRRRLERSGRAVAR